MKVKEGIGEVKLSKMQVDAIEELAKDGNLPHYFFFALMGRRGLRVSEALSLTRESLTPRGVWITQKGGARVEKILPSQLQQEITEYATHFKNGEKLIPFTRQRGYQLCQEYARRIGLQDWRRVHPHRWRHYFGTFQARRTGRDPWKVRSLMGHKDLRATSPYIEDLSPEEEQAELG